MGIVGYFGKPACTLAFTLHITLCLLSPIWPGLIVLLASLIIGVAMGVLMFWEGKKNQVKRMSFDLPLNELNNFSSKKTQEPLEKRFKTRLLISKNVDSILEDMTDLLLRDVIMSFYDSVVVEDKYSLQLRLKNEGWMVLSKFLTRLRSFDDNFLTKDVVNLLTRHIRTVNECLSNREEYVLSAHLKSEKDEKVFLSRITNLLMHLLLPPDYMAISVVKKFLQEILTNNVLLALVVLLSNPDFLNQMLLNYLTRGEQQSDGGSPSKSREKYAFADTYDQFIAMIRSNNDIEELKKIRYFIVTEIMQAMAVNHLKHQRGLDTTRERSLKHQSAVKGDHLLARNLPRYINQLRFAKKVCDKRMNDLLAAASASTSLSTTTTYEEGKVVETAELSPITGNSQQNVNFGQTPTKKLIFSFRTIMTSSDGRHYFQRFLKDLSSKTSSQVEQTAHHLITFWESVHQMRESSSRIIQVEVAHTLISYSYFLHTVNAHTKIPREVLKEMEQFILGNGGADAFFQTQKVVYRILEERYFTRFVVSRDYDDLLHDCGQKLLDMSSSTKSPVANLAPCSSSHESSPEDTKSSSSSSSSDSLSKNIDFLHPLHQHLVLAKDNLKKLKESQQNKSDSVTALSRSMDSSSKPTETTEKIIQKLRKEVESIQEQMVATESHISRTELWLKYLGQWRAEIYSIQSDEGESGGSVVAIIVHLDGSLSSDGNQLPGCDAWVIARNINEVVQLKRKLVKVKGTLNRHEIFRLRNVKEDNEKDTNLIRRAKESMNVFFEEVLSDESCYSTEEVYLFFSSSPESLRCPLSVIRNSSKKKIPLPFASLFGFSDSSSSASGSTFGSIASLMSSDSMSLNSSTSGYSSQDDKRTSTEEDDLSQFFEELEGKEHSNLKDDVAEPLYGLLREVFDLEENVSWLRKSLIAFVQISYGKTINRQIRETVSYLTSESMVGYYLSTLRDSLWADRNISIISPPPSPARTQSEKDKTYALCKQRLLQNIPDFLVNLMGEQSAKAGVLKLFQVAQQEKLNKQLIYGFIELFLFNFVPELRNYSHMVHSDFVDYDPHDNPM